MKPPPFHYAAPDRLDDVLTLLGRHGEDARVLAGGQSLIPMMAMRLARFDLLVDVTRVAALRGVTVGDDHVEVGATTLRAHALEDDVLRTNLPVLAEATTFVGSPQTRNRGTIGGALAHADPAAEYPAVAMALHADIVVAGPEGPRTVAADDFYLSPWTTALEAGEVLVSTRWPRVRPGEGSAVVEFARRRGDFALAGAVAAIGVDGDRVRHASTVVFAVEGRPRRLEELDAGITGGSVEVPELHELAVAAAARLEPHGDVQAGAEYRRRVVPSLVADAVRSAIDRATASQEAKCPS